MAERLRRTGIPIQMAEQRERLVREGVFTSDIQKLIEGIVTNGTGFTPYDPNGLRQEEAFIALHDTEESLMVSLAKMEFKMQHPYDIYLDALGSKERDYAYSPKLETFLDS